MAKPDYDYIAMCFEYVPADGTLRWRRRPREHFADYRTMCVWNARHAEKAAGFIHKVTGYRMVTLDYKALLVNQIVWMLHNKEWPPCRLKRRNGNPLDDRIENLVLTGSVQPKKRKRTSMEITTDHVYLPPRRFQKGGEVSWSWLMGKPKRGNNNG